LATGSFIPDAATFPGRPSWFWKSHLVQLSVSSVFRAGFSLDLRRVSGFAADIGAVEIDQEIVRMKDDVGNGSLRRSPARPSCSPAGSSC